VEHDNAQLFSSLDFSGNALGYASVSGMCIQAQSSGINQMTHASDVYNANIVTHELGHNLGMKHDSSGNSCPESGFFMNAIVSEVMPEAFSSCSVQYFRKLVTEKLILTKTNCMENYPTKRWGEAVCGNGFVEQGEQCDSVEDVEDVCCNTTSCEYMSWASCSNLEPCCNECELKPQGVPCRAAVTGCDMTEVCDGENGICPKDDFAGTGTVCEDALYGAGLCYAGVCKSHNEQCRKLGDLFPDGPYSACDDERQRSENDGAFCGNLFCATQPRQCKTFDVGGQPATVDAGIPCGEGKQCMGTECVSGEMLTPDYAWLASEWSVCPTCDVDQVRNVTCQKRVGENNDTMYMAEGYCPVLSKPALVQKCSNENLGCIHTPESTGSYYIIGGVRVLQISLIFGMLGFFLVFTLTIVLCYRAVTRPIALTYLAAETKM
jgi:hypothetical protein